MDTTGSELKEARFVVEEEEIKELVTPTSEEAGVKEEEVVLPVEREGGDGGAFATDTGSDSL